MSNTGRRILARNHCSHGIAFLALALFSWTQPALADSESPLQICQEIQVHRSEIHSASTWQSVWDLVRVKFAPASVAKPVADFIATTPDQHLLSPDGAAPDGRNLVFSLEPPQSISNGPALAAAQSRYAELEHELHAMERGLKPIVAAKTVAKCVARIESSHFDFARLTRIATEQNSLQWVGQIKDGQVASHILERAIPSLRLHWELFRTTNMMDVFDSLRSPLVRNVVIVTHAASDGKLIDSAFNEYPAHFFSDISPTIESISIYSCHGDQVKRLYQVDQQLKRFATYHRERAVFMAKGVKLFGIDDVVPIDSVGKFIGKVDRWLASNREASPVSVRLARPYCMISLNGLQVDRGAYAFMLNGEFIGSVRAGGELNRRVELHYPCELEARPRNILVMKSLSVIGRSSVTAPERIQGTLARPGQVTTLPEATNFKLPDGTFQSSLWIIPQSADR